MELPPDDYLLKIYNFLTDLSCCNRCILRYLGFHISNEENPFHDPDKFFRNLFKNEKEEVTAPKRMKKNPCPVCLNCFDTETLENLIKNCKINAHDYKYNNFFFNVSFPKCLSIRTHSMYLHLKKHFPQFNFKSLYDATGKLLKF